MTKVEKPSLAFVLSLIGGILILLGGGMRLMIGSFEFPGPYGFGMMGGFRGWGGMMGYGYPGYGYGLMGGLGFRLFGILGLIFGAIVVISAIMLNSKPQEHITWGILIAIFSVLSIFGGMGGFGIGLVLGLIGGVLAVIWKPTTQTQRP
jgi:Family of unknown function (DUF6114)